MTIFATLLALSSAASAQTFSIGARVGGYGFREVEGGRTTWEDCRMDGIGLFAQRTFGRHVFAEAGLDQYNATGAAVEAELMDRRSTHVTAVAGVRAFPDKLISPYAQLGIGVEFTTIEMAGHHAQDDVLPSAFFGFGADVRITRRVRAGMNLRVHTMGHYDHHEMSSEMHAEPMPAAQAQFFVRLDL